MIDEFGCNVQCGYGWQRMDESICTNLFGILYTPKTIDER